MEKRLAELGAKGVSYFVKTAPGAWPTCIKRVKSLYNSSYKGKPVRVRRTDVKVR